MATAKKFSPQEAAQQREQKVKEITDKLEAGLKTLFEGENFKRYLSVMSKFHSYSFNNTLLITLQKPEATLVAGYKTWQRDFQRNVNKGEKGIKIFAPYQYRTKTVQEKTDPETGLPMLGNDGKPVVEEVEVKRVAFRIVPVFDVSQTNGKELPTLGVEELRGDVKDFDKFFGAIKEISPVPIVFEEIAGDSKKGYFSRATKDIHIKEGMDEIQTVKTAIHEIAHSMLHDSEDSEKSKNTKEVEAESVAYTVCQHFGIDTSDYSFAYVASWGTGVQLPELKASLETIQKTASDIISKIEGKLKGLEIEVSKEQSSEFKAVEADVNENNGAPKEKAQENNIIGNTPYRYIHDKTYIKAATENLKAIEDFLSGEEIPYSGRIIKDTVTFTVSKENAAVLQGFVDDMKLARNIINENKDRNGKGRISQEEIDRANSVNLPQFLMSQGVELKRVGKEYIMKDHDSVHIADNAYGEKGKWFRFSENVGGGNIDFCEKFLGMSFKEAVEALNGGRDIQYEPPKRSEPKPVEKHFTEIKTNADSKRVIAYLTKTRGLDYNIVADLLKSGKLVQEEKTGNAAFLIKDENGKTIGAEKVGTSTEKRFKGVTEGLPEGYGFEVVRGKGEYAYFFESAIDMLSFMQIHNDMLDNARLVSMMGVKPSIVEATMERCGISPENVYLGVDNDEAGDKFTKGLQSKYPQMKRFLPSNPDSKDWNDQLLSMSAAKEHSEKQPQKQAIFSIYQLKHSEQYHGIRFESFEANKEKNLNFQDYDLVYTGDWEQIEGTSAEEKLNSIFDEFNIHRPEDFTGHSLSISDIIAVGYDGDPDSFIAHYVDTTGFADMPDFFKEKELLQEKSAIQEITFLGDSNGFDVVKAVTNNDSFGTTIADGHTFTVVINENADVKDVRRLIETAQDNGVYLNAPSAKMLEAKFGADFMQESPVQEQKTNDVQPAVSTESDISAIKKAHDIGVEEAKKANGIVIPANSKAMMNLIAETHLGMKITNEMIEAFNKGVAEEVHRQTVKEFPEVFGSANDAKEKELLQEKQEVNGFEAVKAVSNSDSLGVTNDNAYVNDVVRLVETAQDNGAYPNAPSAKVLEARIGNTAVRDIANKFFIKMSPDKAREIAAVLDKTDMKFSGVIRDGKATITIDKADLERYQSLTSPDPPKAERQTEVKAAQPLREKPTAPPPKEQTSKPPAKKKVANAKAQKNEEKRPSLLGAIEEIKKNSSEQSKQSPNEIRKEL